MKIINFYLFTLASKYILINLIIITILVLFLNLLEISRILEKDDITLGFFLLLSLLKLPTIISEIIPFVVILSIAFLFKNLITNNELISIRNMGFSILDIFKPIAIAIFLFGLFILLFINPLAAKFENNFNNLTSKKYPNAHKNSEVLEQKGLESNAATDNEQMELWIKGLCTHQDFIFDLIINTLLHPHIDKNILIDQQNFEFYYRCFPMQILLFLAPYLLF